MPRAARAPATDGRTARPAGDSAPRTAGPGNAPLSEPRRPGTAPPRNRAAPEPRRPGTAGPLGTRRPWNRPAPWKSAGPGTAGPPDSPVPGDGAPACYVRLPMSFSRCPAGFAPGRRAAGPGRERDAAGRAGVPGVYRPRRTGHAGPAGGHFPGAPDCRDPCAGPSRARPAGSAGAGQPAPGDRPRGVRLPARTGSRRDGIARCGAGPPAGKLAVCPRGGRPPRFRGRPDRLRIYVRARTRGTNFPASGIRQVSPSFWVPGYYPEAGKASLRRAGQWPR
jgi:hypothetical protein